MVFIFQGHATYGGYTAQQLNSSEAAIDKSVKLAKSVVIILENDRDIKKNSGYLYNKTIELYNSIIKTSQGNGWQFDNFIVTQQNRQRAVNAIKVLAISCKKLLVSDITLQNKGKIKLLVYSLSASIKDENFQQEFDKIFKPDFFNKTISRKQKRKGKPQPKKYRDEGYKEAPPFGGHEHFFSQLSSKTLQKKSTSEAEKMHEVATLSVTALPYALLHEPKTHTSTEALVANAVDIGIMNSSLGLGLIQKGEFQKSDGTFDIEAFIKSKEGMDFVEIINAAGGIRLIAKVSQEMIFDGANMAEWTSELEKNKAITGIGRINAGENWIEYLNSIINSAGGLEIKIGGGEIKHVFFQDFTPGSQEEAKAKEYGYVQGEGAKNIRRMLDKLKQIDALTYDYIVKKSGVIEEKNGAYSIKDIKEWKLLLLRSRQDTTQSVYASGSEISRRNESEFSKFVEAMLYASENFSRSLAYFTAPKINVGVEILKAEKRSGRASIEVGMGIGQKEISAGNLIVEAKFYDLATNKSTPLKCNRYVEKTKNAEKETKYFIADGIPKGRTGYIVARAYVENKPELDSGEAIYRVQGAELSTVSLTIGYPASAIMGEVNEITFASIGVLSTKKGELKVPQKAVLCYGIHPLGNISPKDAAKSNLVAAGKYGYAPQFIISGARPQIEKNVLVNRVGENFVIYDRELKLRLGNGAQVTIVDEKQMAQFGKEKIVGLYIDGLNGGWFDLNGRPLGKSAPAGFKEVEKDFVIGGRKKKINCLQASKNSVQANVASYNDSPFLVAMNGAHSREEYVQKAMVIGDKNLALAKEGVIAIGTPVKGEKVKYKLIDGAPIGEISIKKIGRGNNLEQQNRENITHIYGQIAKMGKGIFRFHPGGYQKAGFSAQVYFPEFTGELRPFKNYSLQAPCYNFYQFYSGRKKDDGKK